MKEYTLIGDLHATKGNKDKVQKLLNLVESIGKKTVFLGDQLDKRGYVEIECLNLLFNYFKNSKLEHIVLVGNHCLASLNGSDHSMETLKQLKNVTVVDKPYFEGKSLFIPYYHNTEDFKKAIEPYNLAHYLFMHQGVSGCDYGNGFIAENELDIKELKKFHRVISGHFHKFQQVDNLTYLGTPFSHNFGESNQDKYIGIFNYSNGELELIKTDFPRHITFELDLNIDNILNLDYYDHNRVILKGTREQIQAFDKSKYPEFKFIDEYTMDSTNLKLKETQTPEEIFVKWFKDIKKETNDEILKLGLDLIKENK